MKTLETTNLRIHDNGHAQTDANAPAAGWEARELGQNRSFINIMSEIERQIGQAGTIPDEAMRQRLHLPSYQQWYERPAHVRKYWHTSRPTRMLYREPYRSQMFPAVSTALKRVRRGRAGRG